MVRRYCKGIAIDPNREKEKSDYTHAKSRCMNLINQRNITVMKTYYKKYKG